MEDYLVICSVCALSIHAFFVLCYMLYVCVENAVDIKKLYNDNDSN